MYTESRTLKLSNPNSSKTNQVSEYVHHESKDLESRTPRQSASKPEQEKGSAEGAKPPGPGDGQPTNAQTPVSAGTLAAAKSQIQPSSEPRWPEHDNSGVYQRRYNPNAPTLEQLERPQFCRADQTPLTRWLDEPEALPAFIIAHAAGVNEFAVASSHPTMSTNKDSEMVNHRSDVHRVRRDRQRFLARTADCSEPGNKAPFRSRTE